MILAQLVRAVTLEAKLESYDVGSIPSDRSFLQIKMKCYRDWIIEAIRNSREPSTSNIQEYYRRHCQNKANNWEHTITRKLSVYPCFMGYRVIGCHSNWWAYHSDCRHSQRMTVKEWVKEAVGPVGMRSTEQVKEYYRVNKRECTKTSEKRIERELKMNYKEFSLSGVQSYWSIKN